MSDSSDDSVALATTQPTSSGVPVSLTRFVGREREVARIQQLLLRDDVRLVTLTGPGGVGKTRLAQQVAGSVGQYFEDGVAFVPLAPLRDPALVIPTVAETLGLREAGEQPVTELLYRLLSNEHRLLILDNFEHLLPAAPQVVDLLAGCPRLTVLVTSRAILRVSGEFEFPVPPLTLHSDSTTEPGDAMRLFIDRARSVRPEFRIDDEIRSDIEAICEHLDGLPLAIELAAARLRHLPLNALRAMLDQRLSVLIGGPRDLANRMQTMRNAIAWSYDLLDADAQHLFRHLAVFSGGCSLPAATAIAGFDDEAATLAAVSTLLDHSLLNQMAAIGDQPRYGMLETIREYGQEQLAERQETAEAERRHAAWYLDFAEEAWPAFAARSEQEIWLGRLDAEHDNIRAALSFFETQGTASEMLRLASSVYWYWYMRGHFSEGVGWLSRALALPDAEKAPSNARALARFGAGHLTHFQGNIERAAVLVEQAYAEWRDLGDPWGLGAAPLMLGIIAEDDGRYQESIPLLESALQHFREVGDRVNEALTLDHLGVVMLGLGDLTRAVELTETALELQRATGDRWGEANSLGQLGLYHGLLGDQQRALELQKESLRIRRVVGNPAELVVSLACVAIIAANAGHLNLAVRLHAVDHNVRSLVGIARNLPEREIISDAIEWLRARLGEARFQEEWTTGLEMSLEDAVSEALDFEPSPVPERPDRSEQAGRHATLTPRELEVLQLVARGLTNPQIANKLFISAGIVRIHVSNILGKLGAETRTEAVDLARNRGLLN